MFFTEGRKGREEHRGMSGELRECVKCAIGWRELTANLHLLALMREWWWDFTAEGPEAQSASGVFYSEPPRPQAV